MSVQDTNPADTARPITTPFFKYEDGTPKGITDWRPKAIPADSPDTEEQSAPKVESAPEPVELSVSQPPNEPTPPVTPAQPPAEKASGPAKPASPGKPTSSSTKTMKPGA